MPELHDLLERRASGYGPPPDLFDRVLDRHHRRDKNRRIGAAVLALAIAAAGIVGLIRAFAVVPEPRPADWPSAPFVGAWNSIEFGGSSQTLTIQATEDGVLLITLHDDSSGLCSDRRTRVNHVDTPSTMTGEGRLVDPITLVAPSPTLTCVDDREPTPPWRYDDDLAINSGPSYTLVLDPATGRLFDNLGVSWHRGAPPLRVGDETTEKMGPGSYSFLGGDVTFQANQPWSDHIEAYIDERLFFLLGEDDAAIEIIANPAPLPEEPCPPIALLPAPAQALVQAIRSNPDLEASAPVAERVGGIEALRLDVAPVPGASVCYGAVPVVANSSGWGGLENGRLGRLYILDLPGGSARALAIWITAPEADFERVVQAAAPVVDSFEFHTG